jgi:hypothetical protein
MLHIVDSVVTVQLDEFDVAQPKLHCIGVNGGGRGDVGRRCAGGADVGDADVWPVSLGVLGHRVVPEDGADGVADRCAYVADGGAGYGGQGNSFVDYDDIPECDLGWLDIGDGANTIGKPMKPRKRKSPVRADAHRCRPGLAPST